jgi:hypothetical protein
MNTDAHPNHDRTNEKSPSRVVGTTVIHAPFHYTLRLTMSHIPERVFQGFG